MLRVKVLYMARFELLLLVNTLMFVILLRVVRYISINNTYS